MYTTHFENDVSARGYKVVGVYQRLVGVYQNHVGIYQN